MAIKYRLGLDVGANSLGWSVLKLDAKGNPCKIENAGSRIFSDGREPKGHSTLKAVRREKRSARRRQDRFKQRQTFLLDELIKAGLFPKDPETRQELQKLDPLELRAKALTQKLEPYQIGRALFHINQRRGFKSNRKDTSEEKGGKVSDSVITLFQEMGLMDNVYMESTEEYKKLSKEEKKLARQDKAKQKIAVVGKLAKKKKLTFGSFLWERRKKGEPTRARMGGDGLYDVYPVRALYEDEFDKICEAQKKHHPKILKDKVIERLKYVIFTQRPLKPQQVGKCTYISGEDRVFRAMPSFQRYRIYQDVNSLEWLSGIHGNKECLREHRDARDVIIEMLEKPTTKKGDVSFAAIKKQLKKMEIFESDPKFNFETMNRKGFEGNLTANLMQDDERIGNQWHEWSMEQQDSFIQILLDDELSDDEACEKLVKDYGISAEVATACVEAPLPEGTANLCLEAARLLTEKMRDEYCLQSDAVESVAKENRRFKSPVISRSGGKLQEQLPYYGEAFQDGSHIIPGTRDKEDKKDDLKYFGGVTNPTVHIALNQIRNVINELIDRYGHPQSIAIELGRELPVGEKGRREIEKFQRDNKEKNDRWNEILEEHDQDPTRDNRLRLRLWEELDNDDPAGRKCPFTGNGIGITDLFNGKAEIEHLIPFSISLDDSFANKVVCTRKANRDKGQRTPYDAFGGSPKGYHWDEIYQRSRHLPESKQWRFEKDALERWQRDYSDFLARHLNDTRYIGRLTKEYLELICPFNKIDVLTGRLTALLRGHWGLNSVLSDDRTRKNRDDHRHHAVDAIVIGMTTRSMLQKVATAAGRAEELDLEYLFEKKKNGKSAIDPWDGFRDEAKAVVDDIIVSHRMGYKRIVSGMTAGQLHNETAYGIVSELPEQGACEVVVRKAIDQFKTLKDCESIRDERLREEFMKAFEKGDKEGVAKLARQNKIRSLRCTENLTIIPIKDKADKVYKAFKGDSNWGYEIYEYPKGHKKEGQWEGVIVSTYEAHQEDFQPGRTKRPHPAARLVMRLHTNNYIEMLDRNGVEQIMRVQQCSANTLTLVPHNEANVDKRNRSKEDAFKFTYKTGGALKKCKARKVHISPTGQKSYAKK